MHSSKSQNSVGQMSHRNTYWLLSLTSTRNQTHRPPGVCRPAQDSQAHRNQTSSSRQTVLAGVISPYHSSYEKGCHAQTLLHSSLVRPRSVLASRPLLLRG